MPEWENPPNSGFSISVKSFGAVGDGVTNDTAAVAAASAAVSAAGVTSGGQARLYFPPGTYLIDSLNVLTNVWYDLGEAVLKKRIDGSAGVGSQTINSLVRAVEVPCLADLSP